MAKFFMDEMTWREAAEAIARGAPAFIPTGPIEGHGSHVPLGCDYFIASAFSLLIAQKCRGIVMPALPYNYSGATSTFQGTVSIPMDAQIIMLKAIVRSLWQQGIKCLFIVSVHGPNGVPIGNVVRTVFEEDNIPVTYINPWRFMDDDDFSARIPNYDGHHKEAMLVYAACKLLGKERLIPDLAGLKDEVAPDNFGPSPGLRTVSKYGEVGYHYHDEKQHLSTRAGINVELGLEALAAAADRMLPVVDGLREYVEWLERNPRGFVPNTQGN